MYTYNLLYPLLLTFLDLLGKKHSLNNFGASA